MSSFSLKYCFCADSHHIREQIVDLPLEYTCGTAWLSVSVYVCRWDWGHEEWWWWEDFVFSLSELLLWNKCEELEVKERRGKESDTNSLVLTDSYHTFNPSLEPDNIGVFTFTLKWQVNLFRISCNYVIEHFCCFWHCLYQQRSPYIIWFVENGKC